MYNRKQRRKIEKELGLLKNLKNMTALEKKEVQKRKREMGRQIQARNQEERQNFLDNSAAERSAKIIQNLIDSGKTQEQAEAIAAGQYAKQEEREAKIAAKKNGK